MSRTLRWRPRVYLPPIVALMGLGYGEDLGGGLGPDERVRSLVLAVDEVVDLGVELVHGAEDDAVEGLAFNDAEPHLDKVHPGRRGRSEVDVDGGLLLRTSSEAPATS
jgi:hypothetical protein